jgi:hypothetical protein
MRHELRITIDTKQNERGATTANWGLTRTTGNIKLALLLN